MKNFGTLFACLFILTACSQATVREVRLSSGEVGYDVNCLGDLTKCNQRAKVLCKGKYRVHNTFSDDPLQVLENSTQTMRLQCVEDTASLEQCSLPGVTCIL